MKDYADRLYYAVWGLAIILLGIAIALGLMGYGAVGMLLFFAGIGVALIVIAGNDNMKFYGGISFLLLGIILFAVFANINVIYMIIVLLIIIGGTVIWHGLRGD